MYNTYCDSYGAVCMVYLPTRGQAPTSKQQVRLSYISTNACKPWNNLVYSISLVYSLDATAIHVYPPIHTKGGYNYEMV